MGIGGIELIVIVIVSGLLGFGFVCLCVFLFVAGRAKAQPAAGKWKGPETVGQPIQIKAIGPADEPIAGSATWDGSELVIHADQWATKCLFDVVLDGLEQCMLTYRLRIKTDNLQKAVYPELWCRIPEKGQFFSRGLHCKVRGINDWKEVEIPFYLESGQKADLLHLNLIFEGPGTVRLKDIEVLSTPVKPAL